MEKMSEKEINPVPLNTTFAETPESPGNGF